MLAAQLTGRSAGQAGARARGYRVWTDAEAELLVELREDEGMEWDEISQAMGIDQSKCKSKYDNIIYIRRRDVSAPTPRDYHCPNATLLDRDRRIAARQAQNLTASIFGDPPPGFSALEQRRRA